MTKLKLCPFCDARKSWNGKECKKCKVEYTPGENMTIKTAKEMLKDGL